MPPLAALVFAFMLLVGGVVYVGFAIAQRLKRCPQCGGRGLANHPDPKLSGRSHRWVDGRRHTVLTFGYLCQRCGAELVNVNGRCLLTRAAYEAGAMHPIPAATVVRAAERKDARGAG